jgi:hypothetical protein
MLRSKEADMKIPRSMFTGMLVVLASVMPTAQKWMDFIRERKAGGQ